MGTSSRPQTQRNSNSSRGADARAMRGGMAKNKDELSSNRQQNMAGKPGAQKDQFGSRHNNDEITAQQRSVRRPRGKQDLAFRESPQELQPDRGARNKQPGRRQRKSGSAKK